jgi:hypothetical protein
VHVLLCKDISDRESFAKSTALCVHIYLLAIDLANVDIRILELTESYLKQRVSKRLAPGTFAIDIDIEFTKRDPN